MGDGWMYVWIDLDSNLLANLKIEYENKRSLR